MKSKSEALEDKWREIYSMTADAFGCLRTIDQAISIAAKTLRKRDADYVARQLAKARRLAGDAIVEIELLYGDREK